MKARHTVAMDAAVPLRRCRRPVCSASQTPIRCGGGPRQVEQRPAIDRGQQPVVALVRRAGSARGLPSARAWKGSRVEARRSGRGSHLAGHRRTHRARPPPHCPPGASVGADAARTLERRAAVAVRVACLHFGLPTLHPRTEVRKHVRLRDDAGSRRIWIGPLRQAGGVDPSRAVGPHEGRPWPGDADPPPCRCGHRPAPRGCHLVG